MRITPHGAARQVTGSMYQLVLDSGYTILVDCGLNYEPEFRRENNALFPFDPSEIDVVLLTHAHLDHSGNLPTLYRKGFQGKVLCTEPTFVLCELLLSDSATLEAKRVQKAYKRKNREAGAGRLYGHGDVRDVTENMVTLPFNKPFELTPDVTHTFIPAGHILGAASIVLDIRERGRTKRVVFSGDLGNRGSEITVDPQIPENVDVLFLEGTYGNRLHRDTGNGEEVLEQHIRKTCVEDRGRLLIPAFSVGRTQAILYTLNRLFREGKLPPVKVFADSPMGITSSEIHSEFHEYLNPETAEFLETYHDLFRFKQLYVIEDKDDVEFMESCREPYVIVSSAGMLEGGRIQKHVRQNLLHPSSTILIAGYCTPGTLGHQLLEGKSQVRIQKHDVPVFATIDRTDAFSAHPDQTGLVNYADSVAKSGTPTVFLTHGEEASLMAFGDVLKSRGMDVHIPEMGEEIVV
ncbi:MAG: MBL fold metallo-hydrolase [Flavobacteriales bacterium]|nr:MBL fold metallo-hydrolase [Flavobacteriales bacterium]